MIDMISLGVFQVEDQTALVWLLFQLFQLHDSNNNAQ
jgi:hypothetical protein